MKFAGVTNVPGILEKALITAPFPIVTFEDTDLKITYANDALLELWGKDDSIMGQPLTRVLPESADQEFPQLLRRVLQTGIAHSDSEALAYVERNGTKFQAYFDYSYTAIRNDEQAIIGVLVICRDVTQQVLSKRKAEESERKFKDTVLQAPIAMAIIKGPEFIIETANEQSLILWGRTKDIIGRRVIDVFPEVIKQGFMDIFNAVYGTGKAYYGNEVPVELDNGNERYKVYINFVFHPIFDNNQVTSVMTVGHDVTELVKSREKAKKSEAAAIEANKSLEIALTKKDEFISLASHELKTPLTSLTGYLQVLERAHSEGKNKVFVGKAVQQVKRLTNLVSDLLDVSKIEAGKLQLSKADHNISEVLADAIEMIKHSYARQEIQFETNIENLVIPIDRHRIEQVMINLLTNAIKYSTSKESQAIKVRLKAINNHIQVEVQDSGIGIPANETEKIFSKFHRVDEQNPVISGLGIGLYISREIIDRHSGKLWVESEPGSGSCFYFTLPV